MMEVINTLPNASKAEKNCIANIYASTYKHVDKVYLFNASISCFYVIKNASTEVTFSSTRWWW